ncbi:MAG: hypothetical protein U0R26_03255 [Solirubrobacterales bacterium]
MAISASGPNRQQRGRIALSGAFATITESEETADREPDSLPPHPTQTPLFHALEGARYVRQGQIRDIERVTKRRLVAYIAGPGTSITGIDIPPFVDLLDDVDAGQPLDLMLHTPGGDVDQAERIVLLCRKRVGDAEFRVIVPDSAKSAGTLIAIAADEIVMGDPSELGPIDPQIFITTASGEDMARPAQSFLDGLKQIREETGDGDLSPAYFPLLDKLDPALIDFCQKAIKRSKKFAQSFLEQYMLKDDPQKAADIAAELANVEKYLSHSATIDAVEAHQLGLNVNILAHNDELWQAYWRLYVQMRVVLPGPASRLFEGRKASLLI